MREPPRAECCSTGLDQVMRWVAGGSVEQRCPACGAPGEKAVRLEVQSPFPGRGPRRLLDCRSCTSQFFDDQSLPPDYYEDNGASVKFYMEQAASIEHMILPLLRIPSSRAGSLADIGCGFGFALDFARTAMGWRVRGIDRSTAAEQGARLLGVDIVPGYFDGPASLGGETFDLVLSSEVIEHVTDPNGFVRGIAGILSPRGTAIFTTPNAAAIRREQPVSELLRILSPGFHLVFFTAQSLRALLERGGFAHVEIEEDADNLKAYASRVPLDLAPNAALSARLYRSYLSARGGADGLDVDLRIGLKYRHFRALVNTSAWPEAHAEFAELRTIVQQRYGFDLSAPDSIPALEPVPFDLPLDYEQANSYFEEFTDKFPCNIVGLLYFRGALALSTGLSRDAVEFFRAASKIGVVARSLRLTMANSDGEIADLFKRGFLLTVLALADLAPDDALVELARILDGRPPEGVPQPLWAFTVAEREWLLGALFSRLVDRGHAAPAELVFDRLRDLIAAGCGIDLTRPEAMPDLLGSPGHASAGGDERAREVPLFAELSLPDLARIFFARGLLDVNAAHPVEALRYFRNAGELLVQAADRGELPDPNREYAALFMRTQMHSVLALSSADPGAALVLLRLLLEETPPPDVPAVLWNVGGFNRAELLRVVFVRLVNQGHGRLAACLAADVEAGFGVVDGEAPDPAVLASDTDLALDAVFCRGMLALNHERAYPKAAGWFRSVYEAACERWRKAAVSPSASGLLWPARYHEALSLVQADDLQAAASLVERLKAPPSDIPSAPWNVGGFDRAVLLGIVFVRLVNRGDGSVAARLAADVEAALGAVDGEAPDPAVLASSTDLALDATFCRAMLALNHEEAYEKAATWFRRVYEAACERWGRGAISPSASGLLWPARYHEALSLVRAKDLQAAASIVESMAGGEVSNLPPVPEPLADAVRALLA
jgi:SAM-dependent methyltransferase